MTPWQQWILEQCRAAVDDARRRGTTVQFIVHPPRQW